MIQILADDGLWVFDGIVLEFFGFHGRNYRWHAAFITGCQIEQRKKQIAIVLSVGDGGTTILLPEEQMGAAQQFVDTLLSARDRLRGGA